MGTMGMMDIEELLADEHGIFSTTKLAEHHNVSRRTVVRWKRQGRLTCAGYVGTTCFFFEDGREEGVCEKENPPHDKGEKHAGGHKGIDSWYDPFDLLG